MSVLKFLFRTVGRALPLLFAPAALAVTFSTQVIEIEIEPPALFNGAINVSSAGTTLGTCSAVDTSFCVISESVLLGAGLSGGSYTIDLTVVPEPDRTHSGWETVLNPDTNLTLAQQSSTALASGVLTITIDTISTAPVLVGATFELDSDGDGVADSVDNCPATPPQSSVNAEGCPFVTLQVTSSIQPDGVPSQDPSVVADSSFTMYCFDGVCESSFYSQGDTVTLTTSQSLGQYIVSEWVGVSCAQGNFNQSDCTFVLGAPDINGVVSLSVNLVENPDYVNQPPTISNAIVLNASPEDTDSSFPGLFDTEGDRIVLSVDSVSSPIGAFQVAEEFAGSFSVSFTSSSAIETGVVSTILRATDSTGYTAVPVVAVVNPVGATPPSLSSFFVFENADLTGGLSLQLPATTTPGSGALVYSVYSAAPQVTFTPVDSATGLFDVQANAGFTGEVPFVFVVTDTGTGAAVAASGRVFVQGSTGGVAINCPAATQAVAVLGDGIPVCQLPLNIEADLSLTNDFYYLISGEVVVGNGYGEIQANGDVDLTGVTGIAGSPAPLLNVTLSIDPGTIIFADTADGTESGLTVTRGSQIQALGTEQAPIRFLHGGNNQARWRGITLQGFGEHRDCPNSLSLCNIPDIDGYGFAGGYQANDSSGTLEYVVIADAGAGVAEDGGRKNALTLMSVGSGTQVSHVQIVESGGDGIEIRGGAVNIDHLLVEDSFGDALYYEQGYQGQIQYAGLVQGPPSQGVALKGRTSTVSVTPDRISSPLLSNITMVGDGASSDIAQLADRGGLYLTNSAFTVTDEFSQANTCVDVDIGVIDLLGDIAIPSVFFGIEKALFDCAFTGTGSKTSSNLGFTDTQSIDVTFDPDTYAVTNALGFDANTVFSSTTLGSRVINSAFFTPTSYVGAVDPAASLPWWTPWAIDIDAPRFQPPLLDSDQDGISDSYDAFPLDIAASRDVDLDGLPDAWNPRFSEADSTSVPALVLDDGVDSDGDGLVDGLDPYPQDPTNPTGTCPSFSTPVSELVCALPQLIDQDLFLTNSVTWLIAGNTTVGNGNLNLVNAQTVVDSQGLTAPLISATLTIQEGTELQFANSSDGFAVTRGSAINAIGSAQSPITVIGNGNNSFLLQGFAPAGACNTVGCNFTDAGGGAFGGSDLADSSGSLRYVLFENIAEFPQNSGPALALMGVGSGTELSHIVIDGSGSRGVYISGGAAHIDHLGITGTFGDSLSWNDGYKGSMQFVVIDMGEQQQGDGIFAASNGVDVFASTVPDAQRSVPTLANVTVYNGAAGDWVAYNITNSGLLVFDSVIMRGSISAEPFESCGIGIAGPNLQGLGAWLFAERIIADCQGGPGVGYFSDSGNLPPAANIISTEALLDTRLASLATEATLAQAPDWSARLANLVNAAPAANFDPVSYLGAVDPSTGVAAWWSFALPSDAIDSDGDGIPDNEDLFPTNDLEAADTDRDGEGNVADLDDDNDGVPDATDAFPFSARLSVDNDQDGVAALIDLNDNDATIGIGTWSEVTAQITDSALQQCLQDYAASLIMPSDIRTLECEGPVQTLTGLDALAALEGVRVVAGAPIGIAALENLPLLRGLDLSGNAFRDSSVFSGLLQVRHLYLAQNHLRDVSGLAPLVGLRSLDLFGNYIQSADALSGLTSLGALNLAKNDLSDASGLTVLSGLRKLNLSSNKLSDTAFVSGLTALESISLANNPLRFLDGFAGYEGLNLTDLDLTGSPVLTLGANLDSVDQAACPNAGQEGAVCPVNVYGIESITCNERDTFLGGGRIFLVGALCDVNDDDSDGIGSGNDAFPFDPSAAFDTDNDGLPDAYLNGKTIANSTSNPPLELDPDIDNDGVLNDEDAFPFNDSESLDGDLDGVGDNGDLDPADPTVSVAYIPDVLPAITDSALQACVQLAVAPNLDSLPNTSLDAPLGDNVLLVSPSESLSGSTDFINYVRPKIYTDQLLSLDCSSQELTGASMSLVGLEALTYLENLRIESAGITDVGPLGSLKRLKELNLYNNLIEDITPLAPLTQLRGLVLWENPVVDVSPLADMVLLEYLDLDYTRVNSVAALSGLSQLQEVFVTGGTLTSLQGAEGWVSLQSAWLYENQLTDISALAGLESLEELDLGDNLLSDISPLANLTMLSDLYLGGNQINDVSALSGLVNLASLSITRNRVSSLDPLGALANLRFLDASYNQLSAAPDLAGLSSLFDVDLSFNRIESLDGLNPPATLRYANFETNLIQRVAGFAQDFLSHGGLSFLSMNVRDNPLSCSDKDVVVSLSSVSLSWDFCDSDSDSDGVVDVLDAFPDNAAAATDSDGDGFPDVLFSATVTLIEDEDDDNDGVVDESDAFPLDPTESQDTDGDGVGDNKDADLNDPSIRYFAIDDAVAGIQDAALLACIGGLEQAPQTTDLITSLYCDQPVASLSGLEKLPYLERLQLVSNSGAGANDLSILASLPDLKSLALSGDFNDLSPLANLVKLRSLDILFTGEGSRDLSPLASLTALESLYLQNVQSASWQFLAGMTNLKSVSLPNAGITAISEFPTDALASVQQLNLSLNPLSDLAGIANAESLLSLNIDRTLVSDITPLASSVGLQRLSMAAIPATSVTPISGLSNLFELYMPDVQVGTLVDIATLTQLESLNIDRTGVTTLLPLDALTNLRFASVAGNALSSLQGIENNTLMEGLVASNNQLSSIFEVSLFPYLKFLNVSNNELASLADLTQGEVVVSDLEYLFADGNSVTDVSPLGMLPNLRFVSLNDNFISSLGALSGLDILEYVSATNNLISNAPNLLQSFDTKLTLNLSGNPLSCISTELYGPGSGVDFVFNGECISGSLLADAGASPQLGSITKATIAAIQDTAPVMSALVETGSRDSLALPPAMDAVLDDGILGAERFVWDSASEFTAPVRAWLSRAAALFSSVLLKDDEESTEPQDAEPTSPEVDFDKIIPIPNVTSAVSVESLDAAISDVGIVPERHYRSAPDLFEVGSNSFATLSGGAVAPLVPRKLGSGQPEWELFASSFGVLSVDKDVIWVNPQPMGVQVLRAAP